MSCIYKIINDINNKQILFAILRNSIKIKTYNKGQKNFLKKKKSVSQYNKNNEFIQSFDSSSDAAMIKVYVLL